MNNRFEAGLKGDPDIRVPYSPPIADAIPESAHRRSIDEQHSLEAGPRGRRISAAAGLAAAVPSIDIGVQMQKYLEENSLPLYGIGKPLATPANQVALPYRLPSQPASAQIALWPDAAKPTHLMICVEGGRATIGTLPSGAAKLNPSVQRVSLATGLTETILRGMSACDGIRATPWGTVLATEETGDGGAYEILNPLGTTDHTVGSRATGAVTAPDGSPSASVRKQTALPAISWEGIAVLDNGGLIGGDELRPGTPRDADGGAVFKFIPDAPWDGFAVASLAQSPFSAGRVYALAVSCVDNAQQTGQGCEIGNGAWIEVRAAQARRDADSIGPASLNRTE